MKLLKEYEATEGQDGRKLLRRIFLIHCHCLGGTSSPRLKYWFDYWKTFLTFPGSVSLLHHCQTPGLDFLVILLSIVPSTDVQID